MNYAGFCGASYSLPSGNADCERTINLYPQVMEQQGSLPSEAKGPVLQQGTPGTSLFCNLGAGTSAVQGLFYDPLTATVFAVWNATLYSISAAGVATALGNVAAGVATFASNGTEMLICCGNQTFSLVAGVLAPTSNEATPASMVDYMDGYGIALAPLPTRQINISALYDFTTWNGLDYGDKEGFADGAVAILVNARELWIWGPQTGEVWSDTGAANFPFQRIEGASFEEGCGAASSPAKAGESVLWLGASQRGGNVVWMATGWIPVRVSNLAVESALEGYAVTSDAIGYAMELAGRTTYRLYFPTADATWEYDLVSGMWNELSWFDSVAGLAHAHRSCCHCYANRMHLLGDTMGGNIFQTSAAFLTDAGGALIHRTRIAPHISEEENPVYYWEMKLDAQVGVGLSPPLLDGAGNPRAPMACLQFSDDGGMTWSNEIWASFGLIGMYSTRVIWRRLGYSRNRVFKVTVSDPVQIAWIAAYLRITPGTPQ